MSPIHQFFSTNPISMLIGTANTNALKAESCLGEIFLVENIVRSYELCEEVEHLRRLLETQNLPLFLKLKLIPDTLYGSNAIYPQFLPDLADMHINSAVAYNHIIAPDLVQNLVPEKNTTRF